MTDEELQAWVEDISLTSFGRPFRHKASFNRILSSTGGRYMMKSHNIEISQKQWDVYGREEVEKIIKHELCHYHLHLMGRGYRHRDREFKQLLKAVGGARYCKALQDKPPKPFKYQLVCTKCGHIYRRKRKMDPAKYACGSCRGKLRLEVLDFYPQS
ncbi:SprT family protein [Paenibacillus larvae]|uniref:SprT-like protein n=1 Tax=Paenibacillus larvae subsp. larvae TaxID=147375 RepID=A0A6C0QLV9_9BACL|nr:SprT family protein [Paenibacillus larvae]QHZ49677.1 SprT-like protein [Paenibacillus larvae subsp. larvae]